MCAKVKAEVIFMSDAVAEILQVQRKKKILSRTWSFKLVKRKQIKLEF